MRPRASNEAMGAETGSVAMDIGDVAFSSKHPPPDMRLRRVIDGTKRGLRFLGCVLSVRTRSDSDAANRSLARSAENRGGRTKLSAGKMTDGTAKVKECGRGSGGAPGGLR